MIVSAPNAKKLISEITRMRLRSLHCYQISEHKHFDHFPRSDPLDHPQHPVESWWNVSCPYGYQQI
jgi:hypothetical protein